MDQKDVDGEQEKETMSMAATNRTGGDGSSSGDSNGLG
jgi:hypothetical protein